MRLQVVRGYRRLLRTTRRVRNEDFFLKSGMRDASTECKALYAVRAPLPSAMQVFAGDNFALKYSASELRRYFDMNAGESIPEAIEVHLREIDDADDFLQHNLVQGRLNENGNYEVKLGQEHVIGDNVTLSEARQAEAGIGKDKDPGECGCSSHGNAETER